MNKIKIPDYFWESIFNNFTFRENKRGESSTITWSGFYLGDRLVIGYDISDNDGTWYYDGELTKVDFMVRFFDTDSTMPFRNSLMSFLNKKYGFNIKKII